jgi:RNA polymerase sigma factor (sigma-70 family)
MALNFPAEETSPDPRHDQSAMSLTTSVADDDVCQNPPPIALIEKYDPHVNENHRLWVEQIGCGSEIALKQLYETTVHRVFGLALRIIGRRELAEEITEDVYMQVWRQAKRYDPTRAPVLVWLQTICRSRAIDCLRGQEKADPHPDPNTLLNDESDNSASPQDLLIALERNGKLHAALQTLSATQRQLLALAFFRGHTHEEIAMHSRLPLGTVKSHIRGALKTLRMQLGGRDEIVIRVPHLNQEAE